MTNEIENNNGQESEQSKSVPINLLAAAGGAGAIRATNSKWGKVRNRIDTEKETADENLQGERMFVKQEKVNPFTRAFRAFSLKPKQQEPKRPPPKKIPLEEMDRELWYICDECFLPIAEDRMFFECPTCSKKDEDGEYIVCRGCYIMTKHRHPCMQKIVPAGCGPPTDRVHEFEPGSVEQSLGRKQREMRRDEAELAELMRLLQEEEFLDRPNALMVEKLEKAIAKQKKVMSRTYGTNFDESKSPSGTSTPKPQQ